MSEQLEARLRYQADHGVFKAVDDGMYACPGEAAETLKRYREALEHIAFYHGEGHRVTEIARQALAQTR